MTRKEINTIFAICILIVCFLFLLVGCRTTTPTTPTTKTEIKTIIQRDTTIVFDTIVKIRPDSSLLMLYAECDSNNNLLLSELKTMQGARAKIKYECIDNYINVECLCDSLELEVEKQKTINKYITEQYIEQQKTIVEKDSFIKKMGWICVGMLLMLIVMLILILKK